MKIIVLSKTDYKEKDIIVNAISEEKLVSFKVRGGQMPNSPFAFINNPLTIAEVEYVENPRYIHQILKNASITFSPLSTNDSFDKLLAINLAVEAVNKMLDDSEKHLCFNFLESYIRHIKDAKKFEIFELLFLSQMIKLSGSEPEVNRCVNCGTTHEIVAFSFGEGGFICKNCLTPETKIDLNHLQMRYVRYFFNNGKYDEIPSDINESANTKITRGAEKYISSTPSFS